MEVYWYELLYRGISPGAFPRDGWVATEHEHINVKGRIFGAVAYSRELTEEELSSYEMCSVEEVRPLHEWEKRDAERKFLLKNDI